MFFAPSSFPESPQLDTKKALILLDFQEDFVSPTGKLYAGNISTFLPRLPTLVEQFRKKGEVVWTRTEYREPRPSISPETGGFAILLDQFAKIINDQASSVGLTPQANDYEDPLEDAVPTVELDVEAFLASSLPEGASRCCAPGTTGAKFVDLVEDLVNRKKDIVIHKSDYSAFADMSLVFQLRTRMVTDLYICGSLSNISVYATVLDAVRHGFGVTIIEDCLGYRDQSRHISAMQQMADNMCAEGIDHSELMDELAGLLGDVISENTFTTKFQVHYGNTSSGPHAVNRPHASTHNPLPEKGAEHQRINASTPPIVQPELLDRSTSVDHGNTRIRSSTIESSPPRKRSTNEIDDDLEDYHSSKLLSLSTSYRRQSYEAYARPSSREKKPKLRVRRKDGPETPKRSRPSPPRQAISAEATPGTPTSPTHERRASMDMKPEHPPAQHTSRKMLKKLSQATLGPGDQIGDGTSSVVYNVLSDEYASRAFEQLKAGVRWQKMYHRTGEVPRLVAVQGDVTISPCGRAKTYPIYRHPSDESPELLPFDHTVDTLRRECEKRVGHPLNHVLIQHYRNSEDNISEHSDKTLDIARHSSIVNLSLGAQRTMTLRTKKVDATRSAASLDSPFLDGLRSNSSTSVATSADAPPRVSQRIPLPNASLFILSTSTNANFLHSIRADKRPACEKSEAELAFNSERISLTFRNIGTFITEVNLDSDGNSSLPYQPQVTIWGQGARGKTQDQAKPVLKPSGINVAGPSHPPSEDFPNKSNPNGNNQSSNPADLSPDNAFIADKAADNNERSQDTYQNGGDQDPQRRNSHNEQENGGIFKKQDQEADHQAEEMIIGFGKENHENDSFDWDGVYGKGFDVVNFVTKPVNIDIGVDAVETAAPSTFASDSASTSVVTGGTNSTTPTIIDTGDGLVHNIAIN